MSIERLGNSKQYFYILDALTDTVIALDFEIDTLLSLFGETQRNLKDVTNQYSLYSELVVAFNNHIEMDNDHSKGNLSFIAACYCKLTTVYKSFETWYPDKPSFSMFIVINILKDTKIASESIHLIDKPIHGFILDDILNDTAASSKIKH